MLKHWKTNCPRHPFCHECQVFEKGLEEREWPMQLCRGILSYFEKVLVHEEALGGSWGESFRGTTGRELLLKPFLTLLHEQAHLSTK